MNIKFKNREELYKFLNEFDWNSKKETELSSVYFLIKEDDGYVEPLHFMSFEGAYFESPCDLHEYPMKDEELEDFVRDMYEEDAFEKALEYEKLFQRDGIHYDIDNPQVSPFLKENFELLDVFSETECLNWLLQKE